MATKPRGGGGVGRLLRQVQTEDWLNRLIDQFFDSKTTGESWRPASPAIHPSGAGGPCERDIEFGLLGHRTSFPGSARRRMDNGTAMHTRWEDYFKDMQILVSKETPVKLNDPIVSGRLDAVVQNPATGKKLLIELKSVNSHGFRQLPRSSQDRKLNMRAMYSWNQPWGRGYVFQFIWYFMHGGPGGTKFEEAAFLFECKDTQEIKIIYVDPPDDMVAESRERPMLAQGAFLEGRLLDRPFQVGHPVCRKCDREPLCNKLEEGDDESWQRVVEQFRKAGIDSKRPK